jgi:hypothetical protein
MRDTLKIVQPSALFACSALCSAERTLFLESGVRIRDNTCKRRFNRRSRDGAAPPYMLYRSYRDSQIVQLKKTSNELGHMEISETHLHSFIIKLWLEETRQEHGSAVWRGHITHVPSGQRRYIQSLEDIATFIIPYLQEMGVKLTLLTQIKRWWLNRKHDLRR